MTLFLSFLNLACISKNLIQFPTSQISNKALCFQINRFTARDDELCFDANQKWEKNLFSWASQAVTQSRRLIAMDKDYKFTQFFRIPSLLFRIQSRCVWSVAWKFICYLIMQICEVIRARSKRWRSNNSISKREAIFCCHCL